MFFDTYNVRDVRTANATNSLLLKKGNLYFQSKSGYLPIHKLVSCLLLRQRSLDCTNL